MNHAIAFTLQSKGKNLYRLPVASTLLHFISFDYAYFVQQATTLTQNWSATGSFRTQELAVLRDYLRKCHPYFQILVNEDFAQIGLDFAIDYLCHKQKAGLESLWAKHISDRRPFWQAVFDRISSYKTGHAINQWDNFLRMRHYVESKLAFIYDGPQTTAADYQARKAYYDLAFSLIATNLGCTSADLPSVERSSIAMLMGAPTIMGKLSHDMANVVQPLIGNRRVSLHTGGMTVMQDQNAGVIANALSNLSRPSPLESVAAIQTCQELPEVIYTPSSFKAILDLEFDMLMEYEIIMHRSELTGVFEAIEFGEKPFENDDIGTHLADENDNKQDDDVLFELDAAQLPTAEAQDNEMPVLEPVQPHAQHSAQSRLWSTKARKAAEPSRLDSEALQYIQNIANDPNHYPEGYHVSEDINLRCQLVQSELRSLIGRGEGAAEFQEWSRELMQIRIRIVRKELSMDYLQRYLNATEEVFNLELDHD